MDFLERRSSAVPAYNKPVSSRQCLKLVEETTVQCDRISTSSGSTDDGEEYMRFHQSCSLPGEEQPFLRPRERPMKFTTRNRRSSSAIPTTPHALSLHTSKQSVSAKSSSTRSTVVGWFQRLKDRMRGKRNDGKKRLKTFFDLSHFNKKKMRRSPVAQANPTSPETHTTDNPSRISSIRSVVSTLMRKTKEAFPPIANRLQKKPAQSAKFPPIANRLQRKPAQPAKTPRSRKEAIAARVTTGKRRPTTTVAYEAPKQVLTYEAPKLDPSNTRSISHMRNISDGTTVSSFFGSERSDESTSTAPTSVVSAGAARAPSAAPSITHEQVDTKTLPATGSFNTYSLSRRHTSSPDVTVPYYASSAPSPYAPVFPVPDASAAPEHFVSIASLGAAPPIITDDTHVRTKPLGFKRTKQRVSRFGEALSPSPNASAPAITGGASAGSSVTSFDQPVGSHLPVSTPHARIASVSSRLKDRLGFGGWSN